MSLNNYLNDLHIRLDAVLTLKSYTFVLTTPNTTDSVSIAT